MIKLPPQNIEAEESLIGSIMLRPKSIVYVLDKIKSESFYKTKHRLIFSSIMELFIANQPIDLVSVAEKLKKNNHLEKAGGISFINELCNKVPSSSNIDHYADIVDENHKRRVLIEISDKLAADSFETDKEIDKIVSDTITNITDVIITNEDNTFGTAIENVYTKIKEYQENPNELFGISCGIAEIDYILDGFQQGQFIGFAAYTSQGKTWDAINIAVEQLKQGRKFCMFSLEMGASQMATRLCAVMTGLNIDNIRKGRLTIEQKAEVVKAMNEIKESGSTIYGNTNLANIKLTILKESLTSKPDLFILDYMQLIKGEGKSYEVLSEAAHYFQNALMKANIPMFALSQISNESAKDSSMELIPFKGSGDIGASVSTAIYKKSKHKTKKEIGERLKRGIPLESEWVVMKNRDGDTVGSVPVWFDNTTKKNMGKSEFGRVYGFDKYYKQVAEMEQELKAEEDENNGGFGEYD